MSIIEEIQSRKTAATDKLATLHARQDALLVTISTLTDLLDAVDGSQAMPRSRSDATAAPARGG